VATPAVGSVVLIPFPFSDLSASKLRPAVAVADALRGDWVLCQITSNPYGDRAAIMLSESDFAVGSLRRESVARPGKLFTASETLIVREIGRLRTESIRRIINAIVHMLQTGVV
jgi:mRNA interferase MazF